MSNLLAWPLVTLRTTAGDEEFVNVVDLAIAESPANPKTVTVTIVLEQGGQEFREMARPELLSIQFS